MSIQIIMTADESGEELVKYAEALAVSLVRGDLKRGQIRTVFGEMRQIESLWRKDPADGLRKLTMLKPKLAYQSARTQPMQPLSAALSEAIDMVIKAPADQREKRFRRFVELFESILAYHRANGGRD